MTLLLLALMAEPLSYTCPRAAASVKIDGKIDEQWNLAPWTSDFVDIEGAAKPLPRYRTRARMMWDVQYFYIAAE